MGCVICNHSGSTIKEINGYVYSICTNCGHVYQEDLKENKFYEHLPYESQWDNYENHSKNRAQYIFNFCKDFIKPNINHADIGCGWGGPMFFMQKLFKTKKSIGYTVDEDKTKYDNNLNICYEDFIKSNIDSKYDFVTMVHVLEHFPDPISAINKLKTILNKGGYAYIEVPSFDWVEFRIKEKFCPVHISYFSYKQLIKLFEHSGFTIVKKKESKYWGNIKILVKNELCYPKENYYIKIVKSKVIEKILFPIFNLIKNFKTIKPND